MRSWSWGNFAAVAGLCLGSYGLYAWRGGYSSSFLLYGTAALLILALLPVTFGMRGLRVERSIAQSRYFAGEDVPVTVTIRRGTAFPAGWIVVTDVWTDGREEYRHSRLLFPGFRGIVRYRYKLSRAARGQYRFFRTDVHAGDWIGLLRRRLSFAGETGITVYPKPLQLDQYGKRTFAESDNPVALPWMKPSQSAVMTGIRGYAPGDPQRTIHWKATARSGSLMTKSSDPTDSGRLMVVLDRSSDVYEGKEGAERFEACIRVAAGLAEQAVRQRLQIGLYTGRHPDQAFPLALTPGLTGSYELLSRVKADGSGSAADLILQEATGWPAECPVALVTAAADESVVRAARILRTCRRRLDVWLVHTGTEMPNRYRPWVQELETAGCRVYAVALVRSHWREAGGAEDVIA